MPKKAYRVKGIRKLDFQTKQLIEAGRLKGKFVTKDNLILTAEQIKNASLKYYETKYPRLHIKEKVSEMA